MNPLLLKTTLDSPIIHVVAFNFEYLVDVETHLNLVSTKCHEEFDGACTCLSESTLRCTILVITKYNLRILKIFNSD